jgi:hypothetical protein
VTELAVKACLVSPKLFPTECRPDTTPEEDEAKGSWVLVSPDLNVKGGFM